MLYFMHEYFAHERSDPYDYPETSERDVSSVKSSKIEYGI